MLAHQQSRTLCLLLFALLCLPVAKAVAISFSVFDQSNVGNFSVMFDTKSQLPVSLAPLQFLTPTPSIQLVDGGDQTSTTWYLPHLLPLYEPFHTSYSIILTKINESYVEAQPDLCFVLQTSPSGWALIEDQGEPWGNAWRNVTSPNYGFGFCIDPFTCQVYFSTSSRDRNSETALEGCTDGSGFNVADGNLLVVNITSDGLEWSAVVAGVNTGLQSFTSGIPLSSAFASSAQAGIMGFTASAGLLAKGRAEVVSWSITAETLLPVSQTCGPPPPVLAPTGSIAIDTFLYCNGTAWIYTSDKELLIQSQINFDDPYNIALQVDLTTISEGVVVRLTSSSVGSISTNGALVIKDGVTLNIVLDEVSSVSQTIVLPIQASAGINGTFGQVLVDLADDCKRVTSAEVANTGSGLSVLLSVDESACGGGGDSKRSRKIALIVGLSVGLGVVVLTIIVVLILLWKGVLRKSSAIFMSRDDADVLTI